MDNAPDDFFKSFHQALIETEAGKELNHVIYLLSYVVYILGGKFNLPLAALQEIEGSNLKFERNKNNTEIELALYRDKDREQILGVKKH